MEKLLKNIQWVIVLWATYNLYTIYDEYDGKPKAIRDHAESERAMLVKNKKLKREMDEFYKNAEEAKIKIQKVKESVEKTKQLLPSEISDAENVALLRQIGEALNIKSMHISPEKEVIKGMFISKQYTFKANATYMQFLVFFEKIASNQRVLNIRNVSLQRTDSQKRAKFILLDGSFALEAYRNNPDYKYTEEATPAATPPAAAPGSPGEPAINPGGAKV